MEEKIGCINIHVCDNDASKYVQTEFVLFNKNTFNRLIVMLIPSIFILHVIKNDGKVVTFFIVMSLATINN